MEDYVRSALNRGLRQITFLEHLEVGIRYDHRTWLRRKDFQEYFREGYRLAEKYKDRLQVKLGVEAGLNPEALHELTMRLEEYPWETIGLSYHFFCHNGSHFNMVSRRQKNLQALAGAGIDRVISEYFAGLILGLKQLPVTVVCHLDAVLRHLPGLCFKPEHWQQIERLLLLMHDKGTALEVNTSGFLIRNTPYPEEEIIRQAIALDIPLVAGSDAHRPEQVGRFFDKLPALYPFNRERR